jgi:hypothetical protein
MDLEFEHRWKAGLPPFDGSTLCLEDLLPLSRLQPVLQLVVARLRQFQPERELFSLLDWHEHDGFVNAAEDTSWEDLEWIVSSRYRLLGACTGETYVRKGFFPADRDWYLRVYVPDDSDQPPDVPERVGDSDLTCSPVLSAEIRQDAEASTGVSLVLDGAKRYFDQYSGG